MSAMPQSTKVVAIVCSDLHLSHKVPIFRSAESNWYGTMETCLREIDNLQKAQDNCPILCCGDLFDKWNSPPELINFALAHLPNKMVCIPGQHDLPNHNIDDINRSAYWTLVESGKIINLSSEKTHLCNGVNVTAFPYGTDLKPSASFNSLSIALCHQYVHCKGHAHPQALAEDNIYNVVGKDIRYRYNVMFFGDNHNGFQTQCGKETTVINCGSIMKRHANEIDYKPSVWLLFNNGCVGRHELNISQDQCLDLTSSDGENLENMNMEELVSCLASIEADSFDFQEALENYMHKNRTRKAVVQLLQNIMEETGV